MAKRIIVQARGRGGPRYRVRRQAFSIRPKYPQNISGEGIVMNIINSMGHSAPLAKIKYDKGVFFMPAFKGMSEGQKIVLENGEVSHGNILRLKNIPVKTTVYNIEARPGDGGIFIRSGGNSGVVTRISEAGVFILMPSKKEKEFNLNCRATIGVIAGEGRFDKPILKAGKKYYMEKSKSRLWPRTSAVKMNAIDHPFGGGRGKRIKSKIAKRNAPPGARVGLLRPRRTGKQK
ncbi:MAG: 50S ribosomal protein L2 [Candidatus Pacearchaeota archaeon]|nr:50S ribosomal protein L2 [Candidatus Pacearchaeota archaeon]